MPEQRRGCGCARPDFRNGGYARALGKQVAELKADSRDTSPAPQPAKQLTKMTPSSVSRMDSDCEWCLDSCAGQIARHRPNAVVGDSLQIASGARSPSRMIHLAGVPGMPHRSDGLIRLTLPRPSRRRGGAPYGLVVAGDAEGAAFAYPHGWQQAAINLAVDGRRCDSCTASELIDRKTYALAFQRLRRGS
jgi:hypothetical protein